MNVPPTEAIRVPVDQLRGLSAALLRQAGMSDSDAVLITDLLIDTDLRGVLSHGTRTLAGYIRALRTGRLNPSPQVRVVREEPATAVVDGDGGLGHPAATRATALAVAKASAVGVGAATARNHGHFGSAGKYTRMVMRHNCAGFCVSGHTMQGFPTDGRYWNPLGNPPMSFSFPAGAESPMILDMGTSFFEPADFAVIFPQAPAAFFKSIGLVAVANLMAGVMAGMMAPEFRTANRRYPDAMYGTFILAVDIGRFVAVEDFKAEVDRTMRDLHTLPPFPGYERYDLPGGLEWQREDAWATEGIPLGREHQHALEQIADELEIPVPWR
jgi:LDH2 family malate/lactate/ureidoglycolate dehydrogenase